MDKNLALLFFGLGALISCTLLTGTSATSSDSDSYSSETSSTEETLTLRNRELSRLLVSMKATVERLKLKARPVFDLDLYILDGQLRNCESLLKQEDERREDWREFLPNRYYHRQYKFGSIHDNDFETPARYSARRYFGEERNLRTPNTRMNDVERELAGIRTTQEELLKELRGQSILQIQMRRDMAQALEEIKEKRNGDENEQALNALFVRSNAVENLGGQVDSLQFSINELIRSTQENNEEMKSASADSTADLKGSIAASVGTVGALIAQELNRSINKVLEAQRDLYRNRTEVERTPSNIHVSIEAQKSNDTIDERFQANEIPDNDKQILILTEETSNAIRGVEESAEVNDTDNEQSSTTETDESQQSEGATESVRLTEGTRSSSTVSESSEVTEKIQPRESASEADPYSSIDKIEILRSTHPLYDFY